MNNDLDQFSEERLIQMERALSIGSLDDRPTMDEMLKITRIALAAKQVKPIGSGEDVLVMPDGLHRDTKALLLVFASAMAVKLHKAEQKYGYSNMWMLGDWQDKCLNDFNHHITKGDPLDVANYCAFMHYHGWGTSK